MTTDDRDSDSSNPSKSFKVGEFDRLSGFFTPVWESKRRLRSESPVPSSSAAASAPSSARGADRGAARSAPATGGSPPSRSAAGAQPTPGSAAPPAAGIKANAASTAAAPSRPPRARPRTAVRTSAPEATAQPHASSATPQGSITATAANDARASSEGTLNHDPALRDELGTAPPTQRDQGLAPQPSASDGADLELGAGDLAGTGARTSAPVDAPPDAAAALAIAAAQGVPVAQAAAAAAVIPAAQVATVGATDTSEADAASALTPSVSVRPVIPMPNTPGRVPPRPKVSSAPPAALAGALKHAGQNLEPDDFFEREPELRASLEALPRGVAKPELQQRSGRATAAAGAVHDKLRAKLPLESADTFGRHRETESEREALQAAAARAALEPSNPYPSQVLRTLRRSLHLSTPLPETVRHMLEKYRY